MTSYDFSFEAKKRLQIRKMMADDYDILDIQKAIDESVYEIRSTHFIFGLRQYPAVMRFCKKVWKVRKTVVSPTSIFEWLTLSLLGNITNAPRAQLINELLKRKVLTSPLSVAKNHEWGYYTCNVNAYGDCDDPWFFLTQLSSLYPLFDHVFDDTFKENLEKKLLTKFKQVNEIRVGTKVKKSAEHFTPFIMNSYSPVHLKKGMLINENIYRIHTPKHPLFVLRCEGAIDEEHTLYFEVNIPVTLYVNTPHGEYGYTRFVHVLRIGVRQSDHLYYSQNIKRIKSIHITQLKLTLPVYDLLLNAQLVSTQSKTAGVLLVFAYLEQEPLSKLPELLYLINQETSRCSPLVRQIKSIVHENPSLIGVMDLTIQAIIASKIIPFTNTSFISSVTLEE